MPSAIMDGYSLKSEKHTKHPFGGVFVLYLFIRPPSVIMNYMGGFVVNRKALIVLGVALIAVVAIMLPLSRNDVKNITPINSSQMENSVQNALSDNISGKGALRAYINLVKTGDDFALLIDNRM